MKKVLVVGATSGYGRALVEALQDGAIIVGMSRHPEQDFLCDIHYPLTDVANPKQFALELEHVLQTEPDIDAMAFVPGDVLLKEPAAYTIDDLHYMIDANVGYVARGLRVLQDHPHVKTILTMGSQWSYHEQYDKLAAYCITKHALKHLTARFGETGRRALHLCVPTSRTEKLEKIAPFLSGRNPSLPASAQAWVDPMRIAPSMGEALLDPTVSSGSYLFHHAFAGEWSLEPLPEGTDTLDRLFRKLSLSQLLDPAFLDFACEQLYEQFIRRELEKPSVERHSLRKEVF